MPKLPQRCSSPVARQPITSRASCEKWACPNASRSLPNFSTSSTTLLTNLFDRTLREMPSDAVRALVGAMSIFDSDVAAHLTATSMLAVRVAIRLGLDAEMTENCRVAALLH